jgi:hypothetical protein
VIITRTELLPEALEIALLHSRVGDAAALLPPSPVPAGDHEARELSECSKVIEQSRSPISDLDLLDLRHRSVFECAE